ncbi:hypothetical protein [Mesorhizobium sp. LNHC209A00]|uniref:hypothetical protein n=1 Tax=Mesorhizobium TaxID=68287 RepID=UPI0003CFF21D|nr:hypothetical protein [Mesorhizobium sp. LNHC209A00]ESY92702.1 hypothetical protein X738_26750 [Mesorhizobium sp. LNHC209A00]
MYRDKYALDELGAARWSSLHPHQLPEADARMMLMQTVVLLDELPDWHTWCRKFRAAHEGTPGINFVEIWSVPVLNRGRRRYSSELQVLHVQLPASLGLEAINAHRRKRGLDEIDADPV